MRLLEIASGCSGQFPVKVSVPFSRGEVFHTSQICIADYAPQCVQRKVLSRWPDDSIRWCLLDFVWNSVSQYQVTIHRDPAASTSEAGSPAIELNDSEGLRFEIAADDLHKMDQLVNVDIRLRHGGVEHRGILEPGKSVETGPVRWTRRWPVKFRSETVLSPLVGQLIAHTYANFPVVKFEFVIRNPQAMDHPGGNWDLGAAGSVLVEDLSFCFTMPSKADGSQLSVELSDTGQSFEAQEQLRVFQASSGGENWNGQNHVDHNGTVPLSFRGYRVAADGIEHSGLRAEPVLRWKQESIEAAIVYPNFWQNFPKTLEADQSKLRLGLFPAEATGGTELQGGEQKTHEFAFEMRWPQTCLLYTSPSPRDRQKSRMPSSA